MRILVNGAGGMLGTDLMAALEASSHEAVGLSKTDWDVSDPIRAQQVLDEHRPDWVIHCAAFTAVDDCESKPETARRVNGQGARCVALACHRFKVRMLYVSTDYVFPGTASEPIKEDTLCHPVNTYGQSKRLGEEAVLDLLQDHGLVVRTSWLIGAHGRNFVDAILARHRAGQPLSVVDDQRGRPTFTADLAKALVNLLDPPQSGLLHVAGSGDCTWHDLAREVVRLEGGDPDSVATMSSDALDRPAARPAYSVLNTSRYENLGFEPLPDWQTSLKTFLES